MMSIYDESITVLRMHRANGLAAIHGLKKYRQLNPSVYGSTIRDLVKRVRNINKVIEVLKYARAEPMLQGIYGPVLDAAYDILYDHTSNDETSLNPPDYLVPAEHIARLREAFLNAGGEL